MDRNYIIDSEAQNLAPQKRTKKKAKKKRLRKKKSSKKKLGKKVKRMSPRKIGTASYGSVNRSSRARSIEPYQSFPTDVLPQVLKTFISEASLAIGCDHTFVALPLIAAVGAMIGNSRRLEVKKNTWYALPTVWTAIVGESGTAKSPAMRAALSPIKRIQKASLEAFKTEMEEYEEQLREDKANNHPSKPKKPQPVRYVVQDTTVEALAPILVSNPKGVLMCRDELAGWFGSFNKYTGQKGADESDWLSMHGGESITVDRKGQGTAPLHVPSAVISITGGIQPAILRSVLSPEYRASGLAARILMASPPRIAPKWTEKELSEKAHNALRSLFDSLKNLEMVTGDDGSQHSVNVVMSSEARYTWTKYYNHHNEEQAELTGDKAAAWSKLLTYVPKLALLVHLVRQAAFANSGNEVDEESVATAITLVEWFKAETLRTYAMLDNSKQNTEKQNFFDWIIHKQAGEITPREVVQRRKHVATVAEAESMLNWLVQIGLGEWDVAETGGRPKRLFRALT